MNEELLEKLIKKHVNDKANQILRVLLIGLLIMIVGFSIVIYFQVKTIKKVHYRYFNLTNSLEDINNVEIETYHGAVIKKY